VKLYQRYVCLICLFIVIAMCTLSCGVKVKEDEAEQVMHGIYKAAKRGSIER